VTSSGVALFEAHQPRMFAVAYRMLGSASEAEDIVQDAWLRYAAADRDDLRSPEAFLTTIVTRLCLDRLKSARVAREQYIGPWLPEPILTDDRSRPDQSAALAESLTLAFMVLLETLSAEERAVFVLREVFEYSYAEIAEILNTTAANGRQLFHRARTRIAERRPRFESRRADKRELVGRFVSALQAGDAGALTSILAEDVGFWGDGGGKVIAARRPLFGRDAVANLLVGIRRTAPSAGVPLDRVSLEVVDVNNEPAVLIRVDSRLDSVYACAVAAGRIAGIRVIRNPDKLAYIVRQLTSDHEPPAS
jgi:RNA polymerase sigma-70 factor, ECF subfamily